MEFRIADTFTDSLARLEGAEQKAVKMTEADTAVVTVRLNADLKAKLEALARSTRRSTSFLALR